MAPGISEIRNFRLLMQVASYAVTYEGTHNCKTVRLHIRLNRVGDILHTHALFGEPDALEEGLPGHVNELLRFGADAAAGIGCCTIAMKSLVAPTSTDTMSPSLRM